MKKIIIMLLIIVSLPTAYFVLRRVSDKNSGIKSESSSDSSTMSSSSAGGALVQAPTSPNEGRCGGLGGSLEFKVLVGPGEAVGLEPVAVGSVPFSVIKDGEIFLVQGSGGVSYQDTLSEVWGTYSVSLEMEGTLEGECVGDPGSEVLNVVVTMSGEQMVEVRSKGVNGDYPWSGTQTLDLTFPLQEGASASGEGWEVILHLSE